MRAAHQHYSDAKKRKRGVKESNLTLVAKKKRFFVARKNAESNLHPHPHLHHHFSTGGGRFGESSSSDEDEDAENDENIRDESFESESMKKVEILVDESPRKKEEKNRRKTHDFRWETVRLSWKHLVDAYYDRKASSSDDEKEEDEDMGMPGRLFIAVPGRAWELASVNEEESENGSLSECSEDEDDDEEDAKALRKARENCAKFSKEVINRIVFGVAWKKVHRENSSSSFENDGNNNNYNNISWSKYNRDPLETMNSDEYEEDVYERELHAKARFDRRWSLEQRVNWLRSFRKIVRNFREESFGIGKSRSNDGERKVGEKIKEKENAPGLRKALVEDAVFRDAAKQATRRWPSPVQGEEKAFPMYDEWAEKEDPKKKKKEVAEKEEEKVGLNNDDYVEIIEADEDKEREEMTRLVKNIKRKFTSPTKKIGPRLSKGQQETVRMANAFYAEDLSAPINLQNYRSALYLLIQCVIEESASLESAERELIARRALRRQMSYSYPLNPLEHELKQELLEIRARRLENLKLQLNGAFDSESYIAGLLIEEKAKERERHNLNTKPEPKTSKKTRNQKKDVKEKEEEEGEEVITGKIELEHLVPGMFVEIDSGNPDDPWWGEIVRLKKAAKSNPKSDAIESKDEVLIKYIVQNSKGKYEYFKKGRKIDVIYVWSIKECGYHLPCAQVVQKQQYAKKKPSRGNTIAKKPPASSPKDKYKKGKLEQVETKKLTASLPFSATTTETRMVLPRPAVAEKTTSTTTITITD